MARVKYLSVKRAQELGIPGNFGSFSATGSIRGMKELYYGRDALLVRSGAWISNVSRRPDLYDQAK